MNQIPPQSIEAEMSILGGILLDNRAIDTVHALITAESFYREAHREIFTQMANLADRHEPIDLITLVTELKKADRLDQVGGAAYIATLVDFVPTAANIHYYCKIVAQKAEERRVLLGAQEIIGLIQNSAPFEEVIEKAETLVQPSARTQATEPVDIQSSLREAVSRIEKRYENKGQITGIPYGIDDLDAATLGLHNGELIVIAGRPSMGKSAFAGNIIRSACSAGKSALLFTLEMSRSDTIDRMAASYQINYGRIRSGNMRQEDWPKLAKAMGEINGWKFWVDDTPGVSLREVVAKSRRQKKKGLDLVILDYLQLMSLPAKENRVQALGEVSRKLKQLARELDVPVVLLSQLNRSVDGRNDKRPVMSDLRDSGEIEQDADVILFPFRPAAYCAKCRDRVDDGEHNYRVHQSEAEIIIEKQRAGERNISVPACWLGEYQRFIQVNTRD